MPNLSERPPTTSPSGLPAPHGAGLRSDPAPSRLSGPRTLVPPPPDAGTVPDWCFALTVGALRPPPRDLLEDLNRRAARAARAAAKAAMPVRRLQTLPAPRPTAPDLGWLSRVGRAVLLMMGILAALCSLKG